MKCLQFNLWLEFFGIFSLIRTSQLIICQTRSSWASWNGKSWVESLTFLERNWQHQSFQDYLPLGPQCHLLRDQFQCRGHQHQISTSTNNQNMQRSNLIVINVSAKQHKKAIWSCTNYWYIRGQNLIVIIVTTNSKNNQSMYNHKQLKHKGITYDCNQCEYKATTMALWKCSSNLNMKDSSIFVLNLNTEQSKPSTYINNQNTKQVLLITNVITKQQPRFSWECTNYRNIWGSNII